MAGFCELAIGLRAPKLVPAETKSPIVSGGYLKYSRFWETATGDRVRSGLRGGSRSLIGADGSGRVRLCCARRIMSRSNHGFLDPGGGFRRQRAVPVEPQGAEFLFDLRGLEGAAVGLD